MNSMNMETGDRWIS